MKKKLFVVENLNLFSLLTALVLKIFGYSSWYMKLSLSLNNFLNVNYLKKINISKIEVNRKDKFIINHETDYYKKCQHYVEKKILNNNLYKNFSELFGIKENFEKKIGIIIHDYFQLLHSNHSPLAILLIFLNQNKNKYNYIIKISNSEIKKKLVRLYFPKDIIVKSYLENLFKYLAIIPVISVKFFFSLIKKVYVSKKLALNKIYDQKVIFFPHQSIFYGDIFVKNYFYNKSSNSPLNIRNIAHIEYENSLIHEKVGLKKVLNLYKKQKIKNFYFKKPTPTFIFKSLFFYMNFLFRKRKKIFKKIDLFNLVILYLIYVRFKNYKKELKEFPNAKLAIIGNDILFTKILCLALTAKKIMILATMDRSITADTNASNLMVDHYFVPSKFFEKLIRKKKFSLVNKYHHTGIIRKNFFLNSTFTRENKKLRKKFKKIILVLDYKTKLNGNLKILTDLDNNLVFYNDIIEISKKFPSYLFIIRSKDLSLDLKPLRKIKTKLKNCKNIILDKKRNFNRSFHLGKCCDLSIIRACSFVDDMLSIKKNIIIYDKFLSATNYNLLRYRYLKLPVFSDNINNLEQKIKFYLQNKSYLFTGKHGARVSKLFNYKVNLDQKLNKIMKQIIH